MTRRIATRMLVALGALGALGALALVALVALARPAAAAEPPPPPRTEVLALIIANNHSAASGRPELRYADDDAAKYDELFRMLAADGDVELVTELDRDSAQLFPEAVARAHPPTAAQVTAAASRLAARARAAAAAGRASELYFVFAGHGDIERGRGYLELRDGRLFSDDVEAIVRRVGATRTHVILDSCNSFFVLNPRKPGGHQIAVTEQAAQRLGDRLPGVGVFLSTSAEAEVFEWSELQSGIFSHAVRSGLAGAADANHDGIVSYDELRAFVDLATAHVKNPLYRPVVFARAPDGRGDAAIIDLRGARARRIELTDGAGRITVRDAAELPWLDAYLEPDAAATLFLPLARAAGAAIDQHRPDGSIARHAVEPGEGPVALAGATAPPATAARGRDELLAALFDAPFGPRAFARWQRDAVRAPDQIYGVSSDDAERMRLLLSQVAGTERGERYLAGAAMLAYGGAFGYGLSFEPSSSGRNVAIAGFALLAASGVAELVFPSDGERLADAFARGMADPAADHGRVVAATERRLDELADARRRARHWRIGAGVATAALSAGLLLSTGSWNVTADQRTEARATLAATGALAALIAIDSAPPSPTERIRELWLEDPGMRAMPRSSLAIAPRRGGGLFAWTRSF